MHGFDFIIGYLDSLSYLGIFLVFLFYFIPIPEEVLLLGIGYLVDVGDLNIYAAIAVSVAGIVAGGNMWYWLGRSHSKKTTKIIKNNFFLVFKFLVVFFSRLFFFFLYFFFK